MAVNDIFRKVPVEIPNKSGFHEAHEHAFSAKVGTLVPAMVDMLLPNDTISLGVASEVQLPPMATDFYGRVKAHYEAFFVPFRILYGGWQELITHPTDGSSWPAGAGGNEKARFLPTLQIPISAMGAGSLSDYLGYGFTLSNVPAGVDPVIPVRNPLKYLAYHKIWQDWYRDSRLQRECFVKRNQQQSGSPSLAAAMPFTTFFADSPQLVSGDQLRLNGGHWIYNLRQRNFGKDYFTNATTLPQAGQPAAVAFEVNNNQGAFSIASLRAANALQTWMERQNIAGYRYGDQIKANFGVYPSDAALDRPLYLGRHVVDVYNKSVYQQDGATSESNTNNPFASVASKYGSPLGVGEGSLVDKFTATEHGFIFVMFSLVPEVLYSDTIERDMWYNQMADFPFPLLAGVGDQQIGLDELVGYLAGVSGSSAGSTLLAMHDTPFGYTQRYADFKFKKDRVSGLLKDTESLQSFALQRSFIGSVDSGLSIGSSFIEIPTDFLDNVSAVQGDVSNYGCWADNFFQYKKVSTLPAYSIPTLGDIKNTHTEVVENGGKRL